MRDRARPRIDYFATGGTIASIRGKDATGVVPTLTAADIAGSVDGLEHVADLRARQFLQGPSTAISVSDLLRLRDQMTAAVGDGSRGLVISQGTDTIEETAFVLDLLWQDAAPIVITGAMRNPSAPGGDGPANLLSAVHVAASEQARGMGAVVVLNDEIHAARFVRKLHTSSLSAFGSPGVGPIGWISEGRVVFATRPIGRSRLDLAAIDRIPPVALVQAALDDDGRILSVLASLGFCGAVVEGFGGGHVSPGVMPAIEQLVAQMPVVLASRTGSGEVLAETYQFPGSEIELMNLGVIRAGVLDGLKARLLLALCLAAGHAREDIALAFGQVGMTTGRVTAQRPDSTG